ALAGTDGNGAAQPGHFQPDGGKGIAGHAARGAETDLGTQSERDHRTRAVSDLGSSLDQLHAFTAQMIREKVELVAAGSIGAPDQNQRSVIVLALVRNYA